MKALFLSSIASGPGGVFNEGEVHDLHEDLVGEWTRAGVVEVVPEPVEAAPAVRPIRRAGR